MGYFGENWDDADFPIAYLITIRTFGTWLHGDERSSVDTHGTYNVFGAPRRQKNMNLAQAMSKNMATSPITLDKSERKIVSDAITEVCTNRGYRMFTLNVRSNHAHIVVGAQIKPEPISDAFKSYSTRKLRELRSIGSEVRPWSRGRSRRYLWKENDVDAAIAYVMYCQGDDSFEEWVVKHLPAE